MLNISASLRFCEKKTDFVFIMKAQVTQKCVNLHKSFFFHELSLAMCWELSAIFNLLTIRMRVDIFETEKCNVGHANRTTN